MTSVVPFDGCPSPDAPTLLVDDDVEKLHAMIVKYFGPLPLRVIEDHPICGRFQICHYGEVSLYVVGYGADVEIGPDELADSYIVNVPLAGSGLVVADRQEMLSTPTIVGPGQRFRVRKCADGTTLIIRIARDSVDKAVRDALGEQSSTPVRFVAPIDPRNDEAAQWMALARAVAGAADGGLLARSPLAAGHSEQLLVHGLLGFQPHSRSEAFAGSARPATPTSLRRAMAFCDKHAGQPISVVDVAAAARVSVRTLQDNFRTYAQTTPLGYLRRVRLDRAHQDLLAAAESGEQTTVTDIALRWGFVHLSRFAQLYRDTYGHVPSKSLSTQRETHRTLSG
ncbi:MAG: AraC family transcriptional regulator [Pseudonocardiaceae bacterium]